MTTDISLASPPAVATESRPSDPCEHFCTYFDQRFLLQGLTLHDSLIREHRNPMLWVMCMDEQTYDALVELNLPRLCPLPLSEVEDARLLAVKPTRTFGEYCWTLTPSLIRYLLDLDAGIERITYVDADCYFFSDPARILVELDDAGKQVLITPHDYSEEHGHLVEAGTYCVQFVTFSNAAGSRAILEKWRSQCIEWCFDRFEEGRFGDQKYLDSWPEESPDLVHVLRDTALTLAPWNVAKHQRRVNDARMYHFHSLRIRGGGEVRLYEGYPVPDEVVDAIYRPYLAVIERIAATISSRELLAQPRADKMSLGARWSEYKLSSKGLLKVETIDLIGHAPERLDPEIRLSSGTAIALTAQAIGLLANVGISVLVARALGPAGKGALSVVQQVVAIALVFANLGISTANIYFVSKRSVTPGVAVGNSLALSGAVTAVAALPIFALLYGPLAVLADMPPRIAMIAVFSFAASLLLAWFGSVVVGLRGLRPQGVAAIASAATTIALTASLAWTRQLSVSGVMIAGTGGAIIGLIAMIAMARGRIGHLSVDLDAMFRSARYSARVYLASLADFLHVRQDILLLGWLAGSVPVGFYSVGVSFAELAWYIPNALGLSIQAQASRVSHESALDFAARSLRLSVAITLPIVAGLGVIVPWVLPALFGEQFSDSIAVFFVLLPGAALNGLTAVALYYQISRGIVYWRVSLSVVALNILANVALVPLLGVIGAAIASTVSYSVYFGVIMHRMSRDSGFNLRQLLVPTGEDLGILKDVAMGYLSRSK